jgi:hypothetical protein
MRHRRWSAGLGAALGVLVGACGTAGPEGEAEALRAAEAERAQLREREIAALLAASRPVQVRDLDLVFDPVCTGYGPGLRGTGIDLTLPAAAGPSLPFGEEGAPAALVLAGAGGCPDASPASGPAPRG